ncbi:MAG: LPS-assembly protein LptD, partial [Calditrichia bacterium]|nr:LPS-assembly protein LptD [Calditrichia bacterium]
MKGLKLSYNFKTKRGRVWEGTTEMEPGYYRGVNIKKIGDKTMLIKEGYFTSCDNKNDPHFFFHSKKMWMRVGKKLIAKPIVLYIADIPIFYFPLAYMSLQKSRRSGLILPKYGQSTYGRYLKNFGYYWAMNDYMDMTMRSTYYDKGLFVFSGNFQYIKRYMLGGSVSADYSPKDINTGKKRHRYKIRFNHKHEIKTLDIPGLRFIAPMSISASGKFQSDKTFNKDSYSNIDERLDQDLTTTINLRKRFTGINSSLNISFYRNKNLQTGNITRKFPQASFRLPGGTIGGKGKHWYGDISYNYNTALTENYSKKYTKDKDNPEEIIVTESSEKGWKHDLSIRSSQKILKYLSISPSISFQELWVDQYRDYYWVDSLNT